MRTILGFILWLVAINAMAQSPGLRSDPIENLTVVGGATIYASNAGYFMYVVPGNTNVASGNSPFVMQQTTGGQSTNREIIWIFGFGMADFNFNTNFNAVQMKREMNWDPSDPSNRRWIEFYNEFSPRGGGPYTRFDSWTLEGGVGRGSIMGYYSANTIAWNSQNATNLGGQNGLLLNMGVALDGGTKASLDLRGPLSIVRDGNGDTSYLKLHQGSYLLLVNAAATKSARIVRAGPADGYPEALVFEPGAQGDMIYVHPWFSNFVISSNLVVEGSIFHSTNTFTGSISVAPSNACTPVGWMPLTNAGVRYYTPLYR